MIASKKFTVKQFNDKYNREYDEKNNTYAYIASENGIDIGYCVYSFDIGNLYGAILELCILNKNDDVLIFDLLMRSVFNDMDFGGVRYVHAEKSIFSISGTESLAAGLGFSKDYQFDIKGFFDVKCKGCKSDCKNCQI